MMNIERHAAIHRGRKSDWITIGLGSIHSVTNKFVRHIGKESFFDLN